MAASPPSEPGLDLPPSSQQGGPGVFVSYASGDRERVLPVTAALEGAGVRVWLDRTGIPGGVS